VYGLKHHKARGAKMAEDVFSAISSMSVTLPAPELLEELIKCAAKRLLELEGEEKKYIKMIEERAGFIPEVELLKSMPGIGLVYASTIAGEIGDISRFKDAAHLASYGGVAPRKHESGTSAKRGKKSMGGNRRLKNAFIESAQIACQHDQNARKYYEKKRAEGKNHRQALSSLARRRVDVIYAILTSGSLYEPLAIV
jgi:transposase